MLPLSRYSIAHMSMGLIYVPCKVLVQDGCLLKIDFYFVEKSYFLSLQYFPHLYSPILKEMGKVKE